MKQEMIRKKNGAGWPTGIGDPRVHRILASEAPHQQIKGDERYYKNVAAGKSVEI